MAEKTTKSFILRVDAETMNAINKFCSENGISTSLSNNSYYFTIDGQKYRVSNHTVEASNSKAFDELTGEQLREVYHKDGRELDTIYITAGKTRLIEIYNDLKRKEQDNEHS